MKTETMTVAEASRRLAIMQDMLASAERALNDARVKFGEAYPRLASLGAEGEQELQALRVEREAAEKQHREAQDIVSAAERTLAIAREREAMETESRVWEAFEAQLPEVREVAKEVQCYAKQLGEAHARLVELGKRLFEAMPPKARSDASVSAVGVLGGFGQFQLTNVAGRQVYIHSRGTFVPRNVSIFDHPERMEAAGVKDVPTTLESVVETILTYKPPLVSNSSSPAPGDVSSQGAAASRAEATRKRKSA
jgi:hypothetical protein